MGKKSKRRNTSSNAGQKEKANSQTEQSERSTKRASRPMTMLDDEPIEEETADNLRFQDPFPDEFEEEDTQMDDGNGNDGDDTPSNNEGEQGKVQSWNPLTSEPLNSDTKLEIDETAYKMHHSLTPEWPALSFDILRDTMGDQRTRFPHSMIVATGSQADRADRNRLTIMKMTDLARTGGADGNKTEKQMEDEILGEEIDKGDDNDNDDNDNDEEKDMEEEDEEVMVDVDPVLEHYSLKHMGGINRVRAMPQAPEVVATWSDRGEVNLYNIRGVLDSFERSAGKSSSTTKHSKIVRDPFFVYQGHETEGYAMNWSSCNKGHLATGDCNGNIHLWQPTEGGSSGYNSSSFKVTRAYGPSTDDNLDNPSVEDMQWSPTENTVLAAAECGGYVKIYDTRCHGRAMLSSKIHENSSDVNVIGWNPIVSNLLASGGDDGAFSVWDLRNFQSTEPGAAPQPLARFTCHRKPITSLEWHPSDESMVVVSDEDGTYIYDLSIEEDEDEDNANAGQDMTGEIPPQLLFVHCGSQSTKEVHWHPQITSCVMTTALSGYSVFIPSNL